MKWFPIHGPIIFITSSCFNDDFVIAPIVLKGNGIPVPGTSIPQVDVADTNQDAEMLNDPNILGVDNVLELGKNAIWRVTRTARAEPILLAVVDNAIALVIVPNGRRTDLLVLCSSITTGPFGTNIGLLQKCLSSGSPKSKKPQFLMLPSLAAARNPLIIAVVFYAGQSTGLALDNENCVYKFVVTYTKKSKTVTESQHVQFNRITDLSTISKFGKVYHITLGTTAASAFSIFLATAQGIFVLHCGPNEDLNFSMAVNVYDKPVKFVGVCTNQSIYCILSDGRFHALEHNFTSPQAPEGKNFHNSTFEKSTMSNIASCFGVVENSIVIADSVYIRILSYGSAMKSVLEMGTLFGQASGYFSIRGRKDIKLPDGIALMRCVVDWFTAYEKDLSLFAAKFGVKSVVGFCSTDGAFTSQSRQSVVAHLKGLLETYERSIDLGIAKHIHMAAITEVSSHLI